MSLRAGAASAVVNCEIGDDLSGQMYRRRCTRIRDDLEVNLLYLANREVEILLASVALLFWEEEYVRRLSNLNSEAIGIPARHAIFFCTHTHTGPVTYPLLHDAPCNLAYMEKLAKTCAAAAREAKARAVPAAIGWGQRPAPVCYNRRLCWKNGQHSIMEMHRERISRNCRCGLHFPFRALGLLAPSLPKRKGGKRRHQAHQESREARHQES
ncbi:MAG: hypothetical protein N3A66_08920 [Planctomycetota bacterium]|nr:hypothetical protein [Planctomycetota bacterium]